jgi:flagellar hook-basal body complex protein FliE
MRQFLLMIIILVLLAGSAHSWPFYGCSDDPRPSYTQPVGEPYENYYAFWCAQESGADNVNICVWYRQQRFLKSDGTTYYGSPTYSFSDWMGSEQLNYSTSAIARAACVPKCPEAWRWQRDPDGSGGATQQCLYRPRSTTSECEDWQSYPIAFCYQREHDLYLSGELEICTHEFEDGTSLDAYCSTHGTGYNNGPPLDCHDGQIDDAGFDCGGICGYECDGVWCPDGTGAETAVISDDGTVSCYTAETFTGNTLPTVAGSENWLDILNDGLDNAEGWAWIGTDAIQYEPDPPPEGEDFFTEVEAPVEVHSEESTTTTLFTDEDGTTTASTDTENNTTITTTSDTTHTVTSTDTQTIITSVVTPGTDTDGDGVADGDGTATSTTTTNVTNMMTVNNTSEIDPDALADAIQDRMTEDGTEMPTESDLTSTIETVLDDIDAQTQTAADESLDLDSGPADDVVDAVMDIVPDSATPAQICIDVPSIGPIPATTYCIDNAVFDEFKNIFSWVIYCLTVLAIAGLALPSENREV